MKEHAQSEYTLALVALMAMASQGCTASPPPIVQTYAENLRSYIASKEEFADALQTSLAAGSSSRDFRLIPISGPAYSIGTVLAAENTVDVASRDCVVPRTSLPDAELWAAFPRLTSSRKIDLNVGIPVPALASLKQAESELELRYTSGKEATFEMSELSQTLLSTQDVKQLLSAGKCLAAVSALPQSGVLIRGLVSGKEVLKTSAVAKQNTNLSRVVGPTGQFRFSYDAAGTFLLEEKEPSPKFAVVTGVRIEKTMGAPNAPVLVLTSIPSDSDLASVGLAAPKPDKTL